VTLRSLPAGADFKPPRAAFAEERCREQRQVEKISRCGLGRRAPASRGSGVEITLEDTKARGHEYPWDESIAEPAYWVGGVRCRDRVSSIRAHPWSCGNSDRDAKRKDQVKKSKVEIIEVRSEDGPTDPY
jgi:hypothetical protein